MCRLGLTSKGASSIANSAITVINIFFISPKPYLNRIQGWTLPCVHTLRLDCLGPDELYNCFQLFGDIVGNQLKSIELNRCRCICLLDIVYFLSNGFTNQNTSLRQLRLDSIHPSHCASDDRVDSQILSTFLSALSHYCPKLGTLEFSLSSKLSMSSQYQGHLCGSLFPLLPVGLTEDIKRLLLPNAELRLLPQASVWFVQLHAACLSSDHRFICLSIVVHLWRLCQPNPV